MINYNNNSNRPHMTDNLNKKLKIPINKRKSLNSVQAGCSQWQPEHLPENEDERTQDEKRVWLLSYNLYDQTDPPMLATVQENFLKTYATQRIFLNDISKENHLLPQVNEAWPCLVHKPFIFWHYEQLTSHTIDEIAANIKDVPRILAFGIMKRFTDMIITDGSDENQFFEVLQTICKYFNEKLDTLIIRYAAGTESFEIGQKLGPLLLIVENEPSKYMIVLDNVLVDYPSNYVEALQFLIALYFVFNRKYSEEHKHLLEFIQMRFGNIFSSDATKSKSKPVTSKVLILFNKLNKVVVNVN